MLAFLLYITPEEWHPQIIHIYNNYHGMMLKYARCKLRKLGISNYYNDGEDVVQNAYVKIIKYIDSINFEDGELSLKRYILKIVRNEAVSFNKKFQYLEEYSDKNMAEMIENQFFEMMNIKDRYDEVLDVLHKLDGIYFYPLSFRYCEQMTIEEIADIMDTTKENIYKRIQRGRKLLLIELGEFKENV